MNKHHDSVFDATRVGIQARSDNATLHGRPVLLIIGPLPPPFIGPAVATRRLLDSDILARRFSIAYINTSDPEGFDDMGAFSLRNIRVAIRHGAECLGVLLRRRPDAIYIPIARGFWGFVRDVLFIVPAKVLGARVIVHLRAGRFDLIHDYGWLGRAIARCGLAFVDRALVLGVSLLGVYGPAIAGARVGIVPNGMALDEWDADVWAAKRAGAKRIRVAYVSNLYADKGIHVMLGAIALLKDVEPRIMVIFAGEWLSQSYRDECLAIVSRHRIGDCVEFLGLIDDAAKRGLLAISDIAAFVPVKPEGLPWVVLEAMAAALPVIGTPQGTMSELILHGESGFLVDVGDAGALATRIRDLANDVGLRTAMGRNGRKRIEEVYCEERTHELLAREVLDCIGRRARNRKGMRRHVWRSGR